MDEHQLEENQLPKDRKCKWFSFYFTGVASTSGVTFASQCNFHTSSEPTREQMMLANRIGRLAAVPAMDIVVGGLGAKCTARDVQASSGNPMAHFDIHGGKRFSTDSEVCYVVMDTGSLIRATYNDDNKRRRLIGKHMREQANRHLVITEGPDTDDPYKKDHVVPDKLVEKLRWR